MIPEATPLTCRSALDRPSAAESWRAAVGPRWYGLPFFVMDVPNATWGSLRQVYQGICTNTHQNTALEMYETRRKLWFTLNQPNSNQLKNRILTTVRKYFFESHQLYRQ
jgi:hypothetical protein